MIKLIIGVIIGVLIVKAPAIRSWFKRKKILREKRLKSKSFYNIRIGG